MKWLKRRLQKWLGIKSIDYRLSKVELESLPDNGIFANKAGMKVGPAIFASGLPEETSSIQDEVNDQIRKGYDKS